MQTPESIDQKEDYPVFSESYQNVPPQIARNPVAKVTGVIFKTLQVLCNLQMGPLS